MSCIPPHNIPPQDEEVYKVRVMEGITTAVDTDLRAILVLLSSSRLSGPPPAILLTEKETATLILSLQNALNHCRLLTLPESF